MNIFGGKNSGHKRKQMERQKSIMVLSEEMIQHFTNMIRKIINCSVNDVLDIYIPDILIKIIQHQEGKNRLLAELMFQQL